MFTQKYEKALVTDGVNENKEFLSNDDEENKKHFEKDYINILKNATAGASLSKGGFCDVTVVVKPSGVKFYENNPSCKASLVFEVLIFSGEGYKFIGKDGSNSELSDPKNWKK